jgi:hypothetical protein
VKKVEWKILLILCLLMFATVTIVVDLTTIPAFSTSLNSPLKLALTSSDFIEPLGDPVDIDEMPK